MTGDVSQLQTFFESIQGFISSNESESYTKKVRNECNKLMNKIIHGNQMLPRDKEAMLDLKLALTSKFDKKNKKEKDRLRKVYTSLLNQVEVIMKHIQRSIQEKSSDTPKHRSSHHSHAQNHYFIYSIEPQHDVPMPAYDVNLKFVVIAQTEERARLQCDGSDEIREFKITEGSWKHSKTITIPPRPDFWQNSKYTKCVQIGETSQKEEQVIACVFRNG